MLRNSVGIWAFGPSVTRFVPGGYHPEANREDMIQRTERVAARLHDLVDGLEYHYPGEINEENVDRIHAILRSYQMDIYAIAAGLHTDSTYALGGLINPDPALRQRAIATLKRGIDLAAALEAKFIIWPGAEGYNYPFQRNYRQTWEWFIAGIAQLTDHANQLGVTIFLEHKNSEPAMKILMRNIGMTLEVIHAVAAMGVPTDRLLVNMDWQHLLMNGESLAEYAAYLSAAQRLGHLHANDGWGTFDDDNVVGTNFFMQTLELAQVLQDVGYGSQGERVGFDLYPYTEDPIAAVRRAIIQWEFIWDLAQRIDRQALTEAQARADALAAYRTVYTALGLSPDYEQAIVQRRSQGKRGAQDDTLGRP